MEDRSLYEVLKTARLNERCAVMADVKFRSPRDGELIAPGNLDGYLDALIEGGVAAMSTPTDPVYFAGGIDLAARIRARTALPLMRKEFFSTLSQIDESVNAGFDAIQLSLNTVAPGQVERLRDRAVRLGLEVVFGVHNEDHIREAVSLGAVVIAVNNRDIVALELDTGTVSRTEELIATIPHDVFVISESSFYTKADVARAGEAGAEAVLVGTALAQSANPTELAKELNGARLWPR
ncbi:hypothetical protein BLA60_06890 [Actinophytocola xinjiangensis]|uniref:indole-3-glycerol-phosphate synthase n=1 Tax=Actinophytocola xinjiangensis TaxID=485602 RepID=A0A7Z1B0T0_9PSEU|nr:hypothetical protein [Actinophytocola xinjiangensis]OLF12969.1 hypothetical protein BLA60_06890 [Actinophytocola xinjiangensis]